VCLLSPNFKFASNKQKYKSEKETLYFYHKKKMKFVFFFQTSNMHLIEQKYKSLFKLFLLENILEKLDFFEKDNRK
jgi:hypothetical protein